MRRLRLLMAAIRAVAMLMWATAPAGAQEWIQTNSNPSYLMWCDWWWNPQSVNTGQAQWEYWCTDPTTGFTVRSA